MDHIPAWKRIAIKNQERATDDGDTTALNVTTHLATANLSKREKRKIIRGEPENGKGKKALANPNKKQKKDKAPREERLLNKEQVLKDQLRYLIDFYREKVGELPQEVWSHKPVQAQLGESSISKDEKDTDDAKPQVVEVWKFSKQKQNWLLKHILDVTQIPACYDDLLYAYFKDLKGGSKAALEKACQECLDRHEKGQLAAQTSSEIERLEKEEDSEKGQAQESTDTAEKPAKTEQKEQGEQPADVKAAEDEAPPSDEQVNRAQKLLSYLRQA
ncbi:LAME_0E11540g1_1 [Lachancea meyersii CBS 8951]|uniref:LAME_0E11540g1_1 n=1 Tax=Lachancea meyersii CBS 8951 TaxID=1266667 RepID=A0A1G4JKT7_9SACH|nr:LAME_0E11540g1_1 [Lachancea meyersii CBS 8951]